MSDPAKQSIAVVFSGQVREGFDKKTVLINMAKLLKAPPQKLVPLFKGGKHTLKTSTSVEEAKKFAVVLAKIGAAVSLEKVGAAAGAPAARSASPVADAAPAAAAAMLQDSDKPLQVEIQEEEDLKPVTEKRTLLAYAPKKTGPGYKFKTLFMAMTETSMNLGYGLFLLTLFGYSFYQAFFSRWIEQYVTDTSLAMLVNLTLAFIFFIFFLLFCKPLLSLRKPVERELMPISANEAPKLYSYVREMCEGMKLPKPAAIYLQVQPEITVQYTGGIAGFFANKTELIIGMSQMFDITTEELAALLARELRFFHGENTSRAVHLIRNSNQWLQRMVYTYDPIDQRLNKINNQQLVRIIGLPSLITNRIARVRLGLTRIMTKGLLHQITAHADQEALHHCTPASYTRQLERGMMLQLTANNIQAWVLEQWDKKHELPDNLSQFLHLRSTRYPEDTLERLHKAEMGIKTNLQDIVPTTRQRLDLCAGLPSGAQGEARIPAEELFEDFIIPARALSLRFYHNVCELYVTPDHLVTVIPDKLEQDVMRRLQAFYLGGFDDIIPLPIGSNMPENKAKDNLLQCWQKSQQAMPAASSLEGVVQKLSKEYYEMQKAHYLDVIYRADLWERTGQGKADKGQEEELAGVCREREYTFEEAMQKVTKSITPVQGRLACGLSLLSSPEAASAIPNAVNLQEEVNQLVSTLDRITALQPQLLAFQETAATLELLLSYHEQGSKQPNLDDRISEASDDLNRQFTAMGVTMKTIPYPFPREGKYKNVMQYLARERPMEPTAEDNYAISHYALVRTRLLQRKILLRLISTAQQVEKALGLVAKAAA